MNRRALLSTLGAFGAGALAGCATPVEQPDAPTPAFRGAVAWTRHDDIVLTASPRTVRPPAALTFTVEATGERESRVCRNDWRFVRDAGSRWEPMAVGEAPGYCAEADARRGVSWRAVVAADGTYVFDGDAYRYRTELEGGRYAFFVDVSAGEKPVWLGRTVRVSGGAEK